MRALSVGVTIGLASLLTIGLGGISTAQAGNAAWSGYQAQVKRPQFRPWSHAMRQAPVARWRPHAAAVPVRLVHPAERVKASAVIAVVPAPRVTNHVSRFAHEQAGLRAQPTAMQSRFRPDQRLGSGAEQVATSQVGTSQSYFRPAETARRPSYEQLHAPARSAYSRYAAPVSNYAMAPFAPHNGYAGYWPAW